MGTTVTDSTEVAATRRRRRLLRRAVQAVITVLGIALAWRMIGSLSWEELSSRMQQAQPVLLAIATLLLLARWYFWQARWGLSLARDGLHSGFVRRTVALMASIFVNHVALRFFGGVLRGRYSAEARSGGFARAYGVVLFDQLMHQAATTVYTWLAVVYVFFFLGWRVLGWTALATLAGLLAAIPFVIGRHGWLRSLSQRIAERASRSERLHGLVQQGNAIPKVLANLLASIPHVTAAAILTWLYIASNILAQWLLFRAIGAEVPLLVVAAVLGIGSVVGTMTAVPGGLGPMEAALIGGYDLMGIGRLEAVAGTLLYRGMHYVLVVAIGLPSLVTAELGIERARKLDGDRTRR